MKIKTLFKFRRPILLVLFMAFFGFVSCQGDEFREVEKEKSSQTETYYTCSMHPQVKEDEPGKCPLCHMALTKVSVEKGEKEGESVVKHKSHSPGEVIAKVRLRESQLKHFRPDFFPVSTMKMQKTIRLLGSVMSPEQRESNIPARIEGRVEKVYIQSTGAFIGRGEPVVEFYSPQLISAGEEYLVALKNYKQKQTKTFEKMLNQSKKRLRLWGVEKKQYQKWAEKGEVPDQITIYAPHSGIVKKRNAVAGKYFKEGESFFDLVDLSQVWVEMDVYEADTALVKHGDKVKLGFTALPGKKWESRIDFVSPVLNRESRTLKVRTTLENKQGQLKPGMVAEAILHVDLGNEKLVVPRSAVIDTGARKVVWMKTGKRTFRARKIQTGHESDGYIQVIEGLEEGDEVVMEGNFLLDAQAQLFGGYKKFNDSDESAKKAPKAHQH